jgi:hypothetical protein
LHSFERRPSWNLHVKIAASVLRHVLRHSLVIAVQPDKFSLMGAQCPRFLSGVMKID